MFSDTEFENMVVKEGLSLKSQHNVNMRFGVDDNKLKVLTIFQFTTQTSVLHPMQNPMLMNLCLLQGKTIRCRN